jgi:hypothetical protein
MNPHAYPDGTTMHGTKKWIPSEMAKTKPKWCPRLK